MVAITITGRLVWTACRPILKLLFLMSIGFFVARKNIVTPEGSKMISTLMIWVFYPALLFVSVVAGIDADNFIAIGIMSAGRVGLDFSVQFFVM